MTLDELEQLAKKARSIRFVAELRADRYLESQTILQLIRDLRALLEVEPMPPDSCDYCGVTYTELRLGEYEYFHADNCPWYLAKQRWLG